MEMSIKVYLITRQSASVTNARIVLSDQIREGYSDEKLQLVGLWCVKMVYIVILYF